MARKLAFWNRRHNSSLHGRRRKLHPRRINPLRSGSLGVEQLESRLVLSLNPSLTVVDDFDDPPFVNEGSLISIPDIGTFTDVVEGSSSGGTIGLDPWSAEFDAYVQPAFNPSGLIPVEFDTTNLSFSGGVSGIGTSVGVDLNNDLIDDYEIAVFIFTDFDLADYLVGAEITAIGDLPLAILSRSNIDVVGTIDVSAPAPDLFLHQTAPGPGGGRGGDNDPPGQRHGDPAEGAPLLSGGQLGITTSTPFASGSGGGFGGVGGVGETLTGSTTGIGGITYANLAVGIQGGSGGSASNRNTGLGPAVSGGGGGGGIELGAFGTVTIFGQVLANGGRGFNATSGSMGGGGGAGGGILVHGENVDIDSSGTLSAKGGNGGVRGGGGGGGGAVLLVCDSSGSIDMDGTINVSGGLVVLPGQGFATPGAAGTSDEMQQGSGSTPVIEIFDYVIDWGDDSADSTGFATIDIAGVNIGDIVEGSFDGSHTYADNGDYTVTVIINDNNGGTATDTFTITVANVAPTLAISGAASVNEGSSYTLTLSESDPGDDTITSWTINWGDGTQIVLGNPPSVTHTYADGTVGYTISATATDEDDTFAAGNTVPVTVNNVAPTLTLAGAALVAEGALYTLALTKSDPGTDTITQWTIDWGDEIEVVTGNPSSVTHTYDDGNANYTISATATDEDGTYAAGNTVAVAVSNVAPTLAISGAASVNEGSVYTLNLLSSDPGTDTITSWTINWGDGTQIVAGNPSSVNHTYADGTTNYTISATATDEDGTFAAGNTVAVTVNNVAPMVNAGGPYATFDDAPIVLNGSATDPAGAADDPLTYVWDLDGDNIFGETGVGATRGNEVGASPTYNPTGLPTSTQTVKLRVSDGDGGVTTVTTTVDILGQGTALVGNILYVVGSNTACDIVIISQCNGNIVVWATVNSSNPQTFSESSISEIRVRTRGNHDIVATTPNVNKLMTIDGGSGNDLLTGGSGRNVILGGTGHDVLYGASGDDVLLGGDGNDNLFGGSGNDALVGGNGCDYLDGGSGRDLVIGSQDEDELNGGGDEDILIGGWTVHDNSVSALDAVMAIWSSSASFTARVATLSGSGGLLQGGVTVFDDDDDDCISGGSGRDLIFGDTYKWDGAVDQISLQAAQDILIAVN